MSLLRTGFLVLPLEFHFLIRPWVSYSLSRDVLIQILRCHPYSILSAHWKRLRSVLCVNKFEPSTSSSLFGCKVLEITSHGDARELCKQMGLLVVPKIFPKGADWQCPVHLRARSSLCSWLVPGHYLAAWEGASQFHKAKELDPLPFARPQPNPMGWGVWSSPTWPCRVVGFERGGVQLGPDLA